MNGSAVNLREVYNNYYKYQGRSNFRKVEGLVMEGPFGKSQKLEDPQVPSSSDQGRSVTMENSHWDQRCLILNLFYWFLGYYPTPHTHLVAGPTPSKDQAPMTMPLKRTCSLWHESHRKKVLSANFLPNLCLPFDHEGREKQATKKGQTTFLANSFFATTTNKYKSIKILKEYPMLE